MKKALLITAIILAVIIVIVFLYKKLKLKTSEQTTLYHKEYCTGNQDDQHDEYIYVNDCLRNYN